MTVRFCPAVTVRPVEAVINPSTCNAPDEERLRTSVVSFITERLFPVARDLINHVSAASSPSSASKTITASNDSNPFTSKFPSGTAVPIPTFPLFVITNFVAPDLEAAKISPNPLLSTTKDANEDLAEIDAVGSVPNVPLISSAASAPVGSSKLISL
ncbi:MAG: hypothetical protein UR81_C0031G0008 [Candidatus Levybacteria bacterium GW2011_GWB1_35_5]|nr:MAG: hypothetical protein UR81_C0031G0008 [Candidatus Levybacteria bacterium GW2011_GWB1_35_5]